MYASLRGLPCSRASSVRQLVEVVDDHLRRAAHVARAVGERELRPERLDLGDLVDDRLDLLRRGDRGDRAEPSAVDRAERLELGGFSRCAEAASMGDLPDVRFAGAANPLQALAQLALVAVLGQLQEALAGGLRRHQLLLATPSGRSCG